MAQLMDFIVLVLFILLLIAGGAGYHLFQKHKEVEDQLNSTAAHLAGYKKRFANVVNVDQELAKVSEALAVKQKDSSNLADSIAILTSEEGKLRHQVSLLQGALDLMEVGVYEPQFDFDLPDRYRIEIEDTRAEQKILLSSGEAVIGKTTWTVGGSEKEGAKMLKKLIQLSTRAFNNECESCIASVTWSNIAKMEQRIERAQSDINKFNEVNQVVIADAYVRLKIKELRLVHEWRQKKQQQKEEQAEIRRQEREEERAVREAAAAAAAAQKEEDRYQALLRTAQAEARAAAEAMARTHSSQDQARVATLQKELEDLEAKLAEANAKNVRALSMAQQTRRGHVYIISNIGAFGEEVYKIGMTRRLDPMDRIDELGDASVPFCFDVHALICSDDAPAMEKQLHEAFAGKRLNKINTRKEFFRVSLDEIQQVALKISPDANFVTTALADEFRQSQTIALAQSKQDVVA